MLKNRSFLKLLDYTKEEIEYLLDLAAKLKVDKKNGVEEKKLVGKNIALIFEKSSTRTRCAFEVGAFDQGAHVTYLGPTGSQIGGKESITDTAKVLGRMYDAIEYRGYGQEVVEELANSSEKPVYNGLTNEFHPTQILADFLTIKEKFGSLDSIKLAYLGDGRYNMGNSLMIGSAIMGIDFTMVTNKEYFPDKELVEKAQELAKVSGAKIVISEDIEEVKESDVVYTDVWVSMGEAESVWAERLEKLLPYQVNKNVMDKTADKSIFMHCLPAFHDLETKVGLEVYEKFGLKELEVSDEVFQSEKSKVFDQAENRLHTIKAVMVATLG